ncbi:MAG: ribose 5-phosphate isomerase B [Spirochaetes bacterium]|nr:ribose 5-phosphate isomerase B [Spirochaetota bacterium]
MTVVIANDHAGVQLKKTLAEHMEKRGVTVKNLGTDSTESADYADYVREAARTIQRGEADLGIVICGTGIGASITANKFKGIHAALCYNVFTAKMARCHNNANVMALGARTIHEEDAVCMLEVFLDESFEGDRHAKRVGKITKIEENNFRNID